MKARLVDFHCHLDLYPDYPAVVQECERLQIRTLTVTTTPRAWPRNLDVASRTHHVRAALGLHPQLVAERASELLLWEKHLAEAKYVGEVGLDASPKFYRSLALQKQVFERILRLCAKQGGKVLTVHSVRATKEVLDMLEAHLLPAKGRVALHWFTGSNSDAKRAVDLGCYFSVNAAMMAKAVGRERVAALPLNRLLTETDGPFTMVRERAARPADVVTVADALAAQRGLGADVTRATIEENLISLVSGSGFDWW